MPNEMPIVLLRDVIDADLPIFFEQQLDPVATAMAAFPAREHDAFMAHWHKIMRDSSCVTQTIVFDVQVAGNVGCFDAFGEREVCYWLGRAFWGKGIATRALTAFLEQVTERPLFAHAVKHNLGSIRVLQKCGFEIIGVEIGSADAVEEVVLKLARHSRE